MEKYFLFYSSSDIFEIWYPLDSPISLINNHFFDFSESSRVSKNASAEAELEPELKQQQTQLQSNTYILQAAATIELRRTAFNMTCGSMGGHRERDLLCVQAVDCTLAVVEGARVAYSRFLPDCLLPGPLAYARTLDALLTVSSSRRLEVYRYLALAQATDDDPDSKPSARSVEPSLPSLPGLKAAADKRNSKAVKKLTVNSLLNCIYNVNILDF